MKTLAIMPIPLTQGLYALVDGDNYERLAKYKWCALKDRNTFYAIRSSARPNRKKIWMHRVILNAPIDKKTDHINHNGLDNRRSNLRIATIAQNLYNQLPRKNCTSKYKGVSWNEKQRKWQAGIKLSGKVFYLGRFNSEVKAAEVYDQKAKELFGEFAYINFPLES